MKKFINEFRAFATRGNVIELAVAVVVGTAFGKIVSSLVANIITPMIGLIGGGVNFSGLTYTVGKAEVTYGVFLQSVIDFLIVAFVIFLIIKAINRSKGITKEDVKKEEKVPVPSEEIVLLREIRDSVRKG